MDFLQSPEWEKFQNRIGHRTWRLQGAVCILHRMPFGLSYLYMPHPPFMEQGKWERAVRDASEIAKKEGALFLKVDPLSKTAIPTPGFRTHYAHSLQPGHTLALDLSKSEQELLAEMHPKTRYNIKLAERHGVEIRVARTPAEKHAYQQAFYTLLRDTAMRDGFHLHEERYYTELLDISSPEFSNELYLAFYGDTLCAAALVNTYRKTASYLHGASSNLYRNVMPAFLLQWTIIREARKKKCTMYDFWGIDPVHWPGVTRFKKGFGGREILYPPSFDVVFRPFWYALYRMKRIFR